MKYPIQTKELDDKKIEVDIPGLFAAPNLLMDGESVPSMHSNSNGFTFKVNDTWHEVLLTFPWFDPVIKVVLDGQEQTLNSVHSNKARSAIFVPIAVMVFVLVLNTAWPLIAALMTLPLSLLAVRGMRLNHFSRVRKAALWSAMLIPLSLFSVSLWSLIYQAPNQAAPVGKQISYVFYEVLLSSDEFVDSSRQDVVDLLEAFRTTQPFETMELELAELPLAPSLEVSISQQYVPKSERQLWSVRFDFSTQEIGVADSQVLADALGTRFEQFLIALEERQ